MTELQVPLLRAVWFVKVTLLKQYMDATSQVPTEQVDRNMERKLTDAWTETMTSYMHDHFLKFAKSRGECETGIQVRYQTSRQWALICPLRLRAWLRSGHMLFVLLTGKDHKTCIADEL